MRDADPFAAASFHQRVQRLVRTHGNLSENPSYHKLTQLVVGEYVVSEIYAKLGGYGLHVYRRDDIVYSYSDERGRAEIRLNHDAVAAATLVLDQAFVLDSLSSL